MKPALLFKVCAVSATLLPAKVPLWLSIAPELVTFNASLLEIWPWLATLPWVMVIAFAAWMLPDAVLVRLPPAIVTASLTLAMLPALVVLPALIASAWLATIKALSLLSASALTVNALAADNMAPLPLVIVPPFTLRSLALWITESLPCELTLPVTVKSPWLVKILPPWLLSVWLVNCPAVIVACAACMTPASLVTVPALVKVNPLLVINWPRVLLTLAPLIRMSPLPVWISAPSWLLTIPVAVTLRLLALPPNWPPWLLKLPVWMVKSALPVWLIVLPWFDTLPALMAKRSACITGLCVVSNVSCTKLAGVVRAICPAACVCAPLRVISPVLAVSAIVCAWFWLPV